MSNFLNQEQIDEMVVAGRAPQKKNTERIKPVTESCKEMLRTLNMIKLELQLKVDCIDSVLPKRNLDKNNKANKVYNTQWGHTLWQKESVTARKKNQQ